MEADGVFATLEVASISKDEVVTDVITEGEAQLEPEESRVEVKAPVVIVIVTG